MSDEKPTFRPWMLLAIAAGLLALGGALQLLRVRLDDRASPRLATTNGDERLARSQFIVHETGTSLRLRFGVTAPDDDELVSAVLVIDRARATETVELPDAFLHTTWVFAASIPSTGVVRAVADRDDDGTSFEILGSDDGANSWRHLSSIEKPANPAYFESFQLDAKGHGFLHAVVGEHATASGWLGGALPVSHATEPPGIYEWETNDGGRSWTLGRFIVDEFEYAPRIDDGDGVEPAEPEPEEEPTP